MLALAPATLEAYEVLNPAIEFLPTILAPYVALGGIIFIPLLLLLFRIVVFLLFQHLLQAPEAEGVEAGEHYMPPITIIRLLVADHAFHELAGIRDTRSVQRTLQFFDLGIFSLCLFLGFLSIDCCFFIRISPSHHLYFLYI